MKALVLGAVAAISLFGCATEKEVQNAENDTYTEKAQEAREGAPTVYEDSATGGSGLDESVEVEGQRWDTQSEPRGDEPEDGQVVPDEGEDQ